MSQSSSKETQQDALKVGKSIQKPGQTKEQTKLISQGIEKGISEYKKQQKAKSRERDKQQKAKSRERDKQRKQQLKDKKSLAQTIQEPDDSPKNTSSYDLKLVMPWGLLFVSWAFFAWHLFR